MSNEPKWTKGPWVVGASQDDDDMHCVDTAYHYANGQVNEVCKVFGTDKEDVETDEIRVNAHLIAAAPDGADLAELVMEFCGNPKGLSEAQQDELYETALQFMKKARG